MTSTSIPIFREPHGPSLEDWSAIVAAILQAAPAHRVVVFGSRARGDAGPDSDLDLLVILPMATDLRQEAIRIRAALGRTPQAIDIVVTTVAAFQEHAAWPGTIEWVAAHEGIVVYDRHAA